MKRLVFSVVILLFVLAVGAVIYKTLKVPVLPVHYHANFAVFMGGQQVDFSKPEFMHISPCSDDYVVSSDPKENVHLHDQIGNVVHVHANGVSWKTLFENLKFWQTLENFETRAKPSDEGVVVYEDGKETPFDILTQPIKPQAHLLISVDNQLPVTNSAVIAKEMTAVGDNAKEYDQGKIGVEHCGATGPRSFWQRFKIAFGI